jgi:hypothetical protein
MLLQRDVDKLLSTPAPAYYSLSRWSSPSGREQCRQNADSIVKHDVNVRDSVDVCQLLVNGNSQDIFLFTSSVQQCQTILKIHFRATSSSLGDTQFRQGSHSELAEYLRSVSKIKIGRWITEISQPSRSDQKYHQRQSGRWPQPREKVASQTACKCAARRDLSAN